MIAKVSRFLILGMILLLPFEHLGTFELGGYTVKPAYLLAILLLLWFSVGYLIAMFSKENFSWFHCSAVGKVKIRPEEWALLAFAAWSFLSSAWSLTPKRTLIASALFLLMITIFMIIRRIKYRSLIERIVSITIYMGIAVSVFAIYQLLSEHFLGVTASFLRPEYDSHVFGFARPQGTFLEPLYLANFLFWPIAFLISRKSKVENQQSYMYWDLLILLTAFILTLSRGAFLGLTTALIIAALFLWQRKKLDRSFWSKLILSGIAAIILSAVLIFTVSGTTGLKKFGRQAIRSSDLDPGTETERLKNRGVSADNAQAELKHHALIGIGLDAFGSLPQYQSLRDRGDWQTVNNQYLDISVSLGIIGLLLWIAFVLYLLRYFIFDKSANSILLLAALGLLIQWVTFSALNLLYIWVGLAIIWPAFKRLDKKEADAR